MWVEIYPWKNSTTTVTVILFVRMWVEISVWQLSSLRLSSSSSWGCELKYKSGNEWRNRGSHPLREDVSWNFLYTQQSIQRQSHPLREDVSWNYNLAISEDWSFVILFVRMWVEMTIGKSTSKRRFVILFVRMWVEILKSMVLIIVVAIWVFLWGGELKYPW